MLVRQCLINCIELLDIWTSYVNWFTSIDYVPKKAAGTAAGLTGLFGYLLVL